MNEPITIIPEADPSKKNWWYIFSPCVIVALLAIFFIIGCLLTVEINGGWIIQGIFCGVSVFVIMVVTDIAVKRIVGKKARTVWISEAWIIPVLFGLCYSLLDALG